MPGLSLLRSKRNLTDQKERLEQIVDSFNYFDNYQSQCNLINEHIFVGWNKYEYYPVSRYEIKDYIIFLEGKIYNFNPLRTELELRQVIEKIESRDNQELKSWLQSADGEFILYIIKKNDNKLYIINDIFGRLPLYYSNKNDELIVSRHLKFFYEYYNNIHFDRIALAEFLLIGFMLGQRTIFEDIHQLRPAIFLQFDSSGLHVSELYKFNFDEKLYGNKSFKENIESISDLFSESVKNRFSVPSENVLALSGGLDSRVVASSMFKNKIKFSAAGMDYQTGFEREDLKAAGELSKLYNIELKSFKIQPPTGMDLYELLIIKEGMNSLQSAGILPFYKEIKKYYGEKINFITGDNGDKIPFTIDRPLKRFSDLTDLTLYTIKDKSILPIEKVSKFFNLEKDNIIHDIFETFKTFPETDLTQKYIHFRINEKPFKYAFQGEDRHRNYFWSISPFWSFPFHHYLMNCPDEIKIKHRTFRSWIETYSPKAANVDYPYLKSPITSVRGKLAIWMAYYLYPLVTNEIKAKIKDILIPGNPVIENDSNISKCLQKQLKITDVTNFINSDSWNELITGRKNALFNILTVVSTIEFYKKGNSTLSDFFDTQFC